MRLPQYNKTPGEITNFAIVLENAYKRGYCTVPYWESILCHCCGILSTFSLNPDSNPWGLLQVRSLQSGRLSFLFNTPPPPHVRFRVVSELRLRLGLFQTVWSLLSHIAFYGLGGYEIALCWDIMLVFSSPDILKIIC